MEGSLVAYKVFTNGSVLPASDLNTYLMDQSVMVFSSSATRAAALTAPVEGMLTWLEDVNRYENYNGTAWVVLGNSGLELVKLQTIGTAVTTVTVTDAFSATYDTYKIVVSGGTASAGGEMRMQLGTDSANHNSLLMYGNYTTSGLLGSNAANSAHFISIGNSDTSSGFQGNIDLSGPFLSRQTRVSSTGLAGGTAGGTGSTAGLFTGIQTSATSFTSFRLFPSAGNITGGTIAVYGYKKA